MTNLSALDNVRILDFSWVLAGPYATRILADFGAEVIKVQPLTPAAGDSFARGYDNTWNRNKLGITLNMDKPQGVALARRLVGICNAVVDNFSPRVMANWGLDYENLKKMKPDVIMISMSAMGNSGPWRDYVGYGVTAQAFSGMTYLTSSPNEPPSGPGHAYADHVTGLVAVLALLSALEYRRKTGEGQYIDISQTEVMASLMGDAFLEMAVSGQPPEPAGNRCDKAAPYGVYRCQGEDRWCAIAVFNDEEWSGFKKAMGNPSWTVGSKWDTLSGRLENVAELDARVTEWTGQHTAEEVVALLQSQGVATGVVQDAVDLANNPQLRARNFFVELEHLELGRTVSDAMPVKLSRTPAGYNQAAPTVGQDNAYVYGQLLGISEEELAELRAQDII